MIMDITERSKEYAQGKALNAITSAIEQAYTDGYNDGLRHLELERLEAIKDGVEYVDLGLPSGTLWSSISIKSSPNSFKKMTYLDASELDIPTKDDFEELCRLCHPVYKNYQDYDGIKMIGVNGKSIHIPFAHIEESDIRDYTFWLRDDDAVDKIAASMKLSGEKANPLFKNIFAGLRLPVMLVRKK